MSGSAIVIGVGARAGLGAALCRRFASEGLRVFAAGRTGQKLDSVASQIEDAGGSAAAVVMDTTREDDVVRLFDTVMDRGEAPEIVVYNAGNNRPEAVLDVSTAVFENMWRVACFGGFVVAQEVVRLMLDQQGAGHRQTLLFTGASASLRGKAGFAAFAAGKGGLRMLAQSVAREFGPQGIHVAHILIDGVVEGDKVRSRFPEYIDKLGEDGALQPAAIADAYMAIHAQPRSAWTQELDLRPYKEQF